MEPGRLVTMLLAHEHALFRAAIRAGLQDHPRVEVVGEAGNHPTLMSEADRLRPAVVLVDSAFPPDGGVKSCSDLKRRYDCRVVIICPESDQLLLIRALEAGADGYINGEGRLGEIVEAVTTVQRGEAFVPPRMLGSLLRSLIERRRADDKALERVARLSPREREVYALLIDGHDHDRIAKHLVISPATARTHVQNLLRKLEVHSRLEAAALAINHGLAEQLLPSRAVNH